MARPNWRKSILYKEILRNYERSGAPLTANERKVLREQLVRVASESLDNGELRHKWFCHNRPLIDAFTWNNSILGDSYWRGIYRAGRRPTRIKNT